MRKRSPLTRRPDETENETEGTRRRKPRPSISDKAEQAFQQTGMAEKGRERAIHILGMIMFGL